MDATPEIPLPSSADAAGPTGATQMMEGMTQGPGTAPADSPANPTPDQQQAQQAPAADAQAQQQQQQPAKTAPPTGASAEVRAMCDVAMELLKGAPGTPGYSILMKSLEGGDASVASALVRDFVARQPKAARGAESDAAPSASATIAASRAPPPAGFASGRQQQVAPPQQQQQQQPSGQLQPFGAATTGMVVVASANRPRQDRKSVV